MATENTLWLPPLSSKSQRELDSFQKKRRTKWTGFAHKTLWDWLQLLIIPVVLAAGVAWFNFMQTQISFVSSQKQHDTDVQIALDQQQQEALVTYQNYISDLLLTQHLGSSRVGDEVRVVAGARTLNTLRQLDSERKGLLILFLYEAQLITGGSPIISLVNADLRKAYLNEADLRANLHGGVNLVGLNEVDLHGANLHGAYLTGAYLRGTHLEGADLSGTHLEGIDLSGAHLEGANLSEAYLSEAYLSGAHLDSADLHGSDLSDADLSDAVLRGANVTTEQLDKTKSLGGAIIPDGSKQP